MGQDSLHVSFDHPGRSRHGLEQLPGLLPNRLHPSAPVPEHFLGDLDVLPLINALKHQPDLLGHTRHAPFQGHRLPLVGLLLRPVRSVLEPHPPRPPQKLPLTGIGPTLRLLDLVARLQHILDDVELVVHHPSVPEVVANGLGVGGVHVDGHMLNRLRVAVVPLQFRSQCLPNRDVLAGRLEEHLLGKQVGEHRQVVVPFAPVHLVGTHPDHVAETPERVRRLDVGEEHSPHPRVALTEDPAGALHGHLALQSQSKGLKILGEMLAASLLRRSDTVQPCRRHHGILAAAR